MTTALILSRAVPLGGELTANTSPSALVRPDAWIDEAVCADSVGSLVSLFFSENLDDIARAKAVCVGCPVRTECLGAALERSEPWGVWGGEMIVGGKVLAERRRRGRPPKVRIIAQASLESDADLADEDVFIAQSA